MAESKTEGLKTEERRKRFVSAYLKDFNATRAAIEAGYSENSAEMAGSRMMRNDKVQEAIKAASEKLCKKAEIKVEELVFELKNIALNDMRDVVEWGPGGVVLKRSSDLTPDVARTVSEVSESKNKEGSTYKIKTHDKLKAIEMIGRHLGMWKDQVDVNVNYKPIVIQKLDGSTIELSRAKAQIEGAVEPEIVEGEDDADR